MKGIDVYRNKKNNFMVARIHYTADPDKATSEWFVKTKKGMPKMAWNKEYEIDFGALSGQRIWEMFDPEIHVIPYFDIPKEWTRIRGIDYGSFNPTCCLWGGVDYDDNMYIYREYFKGGRVIAKHHAQEIRKMSKIEVGEKYTDQDEEYVDTVIDPTTKAKNQSKDNIPYSVMEIFDDNGVSCSPANNDTNAGWDQVGDYFEPREIYDGNGKIVETKPKLFIFERCKDLIREIPDYRYKEQSAEVAKKQDPDEKAAKKKDHACDALRYLMMERPAVTERKPKQMTRVQRDIHRAAMGFKGYNQKLVDQFNQT